MSESNLATIYEATVDLGSLGTRNCLVFEYATEGPKMIVYIDKTTGWTLKVKAVMASEDLINLSLDVNLAKTNIPRLK